MKEDKVEKCPLYRETKMSILYDLSILSNQEGKKRVRLKKKKMERDEMKSTPTNLYHVNLFFKCERRGL